MSWAASDMNQHEMAPKWPDVPICAHIVPTSLHKASLVPEKTTVGAGWCLSQPGMATKWPNGTNWCSDGAKFTSDGQLGVRNYL